MISSWPPSHCREARSEFPSATYVDVQVTFSPTEVYEVFVGANNLFDEEPPLIISGLPGDVTGTETDAGTYDAIGRRWYAGVRMRF